MKVLGHTTTLGSIVELPQEEASSLARLRGEAVAVYGGPSEPDAAALRKLHLWLRAYAFNCAHTDRVEQMTKKRRNPDCCVFAGLDWPISCAAHARAKERSRCAALADDRQHASTQRRKRKTPLEDARGREGSKAQRAVRVPGDRGGKRITRINFTAAKSVRSKA